MIDHPATRAIAVGMEVISISTIAGWLLGILPPLATFVGMCWYALQIFESPTFQNFLARLKKEVIDDKP